MDIEGAARATLRRALEAAGGRARGDAFVEEWRRRTSRRREGMDGGEEIALARGAALRIWDGGEFRFASADGAPLGALSACQRLLAPARPGPHPPEPPRAEARPRREASAGTMVMPPAGAPGAGGAMLAALETELTALLPGARFDFVLESAERASQVWTESGATPPANWRWTRVHVRAARDGQVAAWAGGAPDLTSFARRHPGKAVAGALARRLEAATTSPATLPGCDADTPIVFGPGQGAALVHELLHGLEADAVVAGWSPWSEPSGIHAGRLRTEPVLSPLLTVWDDPTRPGLRGTYRHDDEGTRADRRQLIRQGHVVGCLGDRRSAEAEQSFPAGHGRRPTCREWPRPRAANICLATGRHTTAELRVARGPVLVVHEIAAGGTDPLSAAFTLVVSDGEWWDGIRRLGAVAGLLLEGDALDVLGRIDRLGADAAPDAGAATCWRDGEGVPMACVSPSLRVRGLNRIAVGAGA